MFYLIVHLNDHGREEDVLLAMAAAGILEAVVLPARSVAERLAEGVALFAGFRADLLAQGTAALVIAAPVPDAEAAGRLKTELRRAGLDLESGADGRLVLLPVAEVPEAGGRGEPSDA